jgi:hypothetical protein
VNDVPKLSTYLAKTIYVLLKHEAIEPTDIVWIEPSQKKEGEEDDDDMIFVEEYYKLMAALLVHYYEEKKDWKEVEKFFNNNFKKQFDILKPKILEDNLFQDIEDAIGSDYAKVIAIIN